MNFKSDLLALQSAAPIALNLFEHHRTQNNRFAMCYGDNEYLQLQITVNGGSTGRLDFNNKEYAAAWGNITEGFSKQSFYIFDTIKKAVKIDARSNLLWGLMYNLDYVFGDIIQITEENGIYKVRLGNGYCCYLKLSDDPKAYESVCFTARTITLLDSKKRVVLEDITSSDALNAIAQLASTPDVRTSRFSDVAKSVGGYISPISAFRTRNDTTDTVKAVFPNGRGLSFAVKDNEMLLTFYEAYINSLGKKRYKKLKTEVYKDFDALEAEIHRLAGLPII